MLIKDIEGFEGLYYVTSDGDVWSYGGKSNHKNDLKLSPSIDKDGYRRVALHNNNKKKYFRINRLVAMSFIPTIKGKNLVNHIDKNKQNDNYKNLEWVTPFENWKHSESEMPTTMIKVAKVCKITNNILEIYDSLMEASRQNNINQGNITNCIKGRCKSVGGFIWKKIEQLEAK